MGCLLMLYLRRDFDGKNAKWKLEVIIGSMLHSETYYEQFLDTIVALN